MPTKKNIWHPLLLLFTVLVVTICTGCSDACSNHEGAAQLADEIVNEGLTDVRHALTRVDSAEQAGVFTAIRAHTVKAIICENADQRRMAAYYAEKAIAAEEGHAVATAADSSLWCTARCILADDAYANGEYGKSLALSKEILAFVSEGTSPKDWAMKSRALLQMADCESELNNITEAERLFLQSIDILMESTQHATDYGEVDPLIYTLLALNDLYIDNKMPKRALPMLAKTDTAMSRLIRCSSDAEWVVQMRRNNVTISKAIVYAANGQRDQAEALFHEHCQSPGLVVADKTAEGVYLTMTGRNDEAIRLFDEVDSLMRASGEPITDIYVKTLLKHKYDALQRAGRTADALAMSDYMRQLTDSLRQQERQADIEQMKEIKQQEELIAKKHQTIVMHRIILVAAFLICLLVGYLLWRSHQYNKRLFEKNRRLLAEIEQRERDEQQAIEQLEEAPEKSLTAEQQLYRRLCELMDAPDRIYTDADLDRNRLAQLLGTNEHYVSDAISSCTGGKSTTDFINGYRLRYATHLLATTTDSVSLIAERCGLSRRTFYRLFNEAYSMSPSDFRQVRNNHIKT